MIIQMILWISLAVLGCAAFAALGIWAAITDEGHTAQRLRAIEMQAIPVLAHKAEETQVLLVRMGPPGLLRPVVITPRAADPCAPDRFRVRITLRPERKFMGLATSAALGLPGRSARGI
jgi:hypothetical protein